jgi:hypothetical protein
VVQYFSRAQPAPFTLGNAPRSLPNVRAPGRRGIDLSFFKNFFGEKRYVEFRGVLQLHQHAEFGVPGGTAAAGTFGVISNQTNTPARFSSA